MDSVHQCFLLGASAAIATAANIPTEVFLASWCGGRSLGEVAAVAERLEAALGGPRELEAAARALTSWAPLHDLASHVCDPLAAARRVLLTLLSNDHAELIGAIEPGSSGRLVVTFTHVDRDRLSGAVVRLVAGLCIASTARLCREEPRMVTSARPGDTRFVFSATPAQNPSSMETASGAARARLVAAAHDARRASSRLASLERELARAPLDGREPAVLAQRTVLLARATFSRLRACPSESTPRTLPAIGERSAGARAFVLRAGGRVVGTWEVRADTEPAVLAAIAPWLACALRPPRSQLVGATTAPPVPAAWTLTAAQRRVAGRWLVGSTAKEIARELQIAPSTVQTHVAAIHRRLEVRSRAKLFARSAALAPTRARTDASERDRGDEAWPPLPADIDGAVGAIAALRERTAQAIESLRRCGQRAADGVLDDTPPTRLAPEERGSSPVPHAWALTARQREIVDQLVAGASSQQIATTLGVRPHTVDTHLRNIYERTGLRSRHLVAAAVNAFRQSLAAAP